MQSHFITEKPDCKSSLQNKMYTLPLTPKTDACYNLLMIVKKESEYTKSFMPSVVITGKRGCKLLTNTKSKVDETTRLASDTLGHSLTKEHKESVMASRDGAEGRGVQSPFMTPNQN